MPDLRLRGINIYYEESGSGPALVLLPGLGMAVPQWGGFPGMLAGHLRVIAPDLRGLGKSGRGEGALSLSVFADDLLALLDHLGVERAALCGLSFGGVLAQYIACRHPERVSKLILVATHGRESKRFAATRESFALMMSRLTPSEVSAALLPFLFSREFFETSQALPSLRERLTMPASQVQTALEQLAAAADQSWVDGIARIAAPTLVIAGEEDAVIAPEDTRELAATIPNARLETLPGVGHSPMAEQPRHCAKLILSFVK